MSESDHLAGWRITEDAYPRSGSDEEKLIFFVGCAVLAPSVHNTQPWKFSFSGKGLELRVDRGRRLPAVDPHGRSAIISCGAALFNLRAAMYHFGCEGKASVFPDPQEPDLLARVSLEGTGAPTTEWTSLFRAIPRRVTNRSAFESHAVAPAIIHELHQAARIEGAWFAELADQRSREQAEVLIVKATRVQYRNPALRRELAQWLRPSGEREGIPRYALGMTELADYLTASLPYMLRNFDVSDSAGERYRRLASAAPLLVCLGTARNDDLAWLNAGQALQRVLLTAARHDLHASFMNHPVEVAKFKHRLSALINRRGHPQLLLRLGYGPRRRHTPRRAMDEVMSA